MAIELVPRREMNVFLISIYFRNLSSVLGIHNLPFDAYTYGGGRCLLVLQGPSSGLVTPHLGGLFSAAWTLLDPSGVLARSSSVSPL